MYGIVRQSDGHIAVRSTPGQGTIFEVHLPRVQEAVPEEREEDAPVLPPGSETVLVVEDDDLVRSIARRILEASGYTVLDAASGSDALQLGAAHPAIQLLVTDVVMPGMNGRELAERLLAQNPALKVIYMSGYANSTVVQQQVLAPDTPFLQKPFDVKGLLEKVRGVLDD